MEQKPSLWMPEKDQRALAVLGKLLEELGEGTAATARCLIQGINECEPVTGKPNKIWLMEELSDIDAMKETTVKFFNLDRDFISQRTEKKIIYHQRWRGMIRTANNFGFRA